MHGHWLKDYIGPKASAGGVDIPTPTVADAGKSIVVNEEGQYGLANSGGGTPLIVNDVNNILDKTWQEIHDAFVGGQIVIIHGSDGNDSDELVTSVRLYNGYYLVGLSTGTTYGASSANGYPEDHES